MNSIFGALFIYLLFYLRLSIYRIKVIMNLFSFAQCKPYAIVYLKFCVCVFLCVFVCVCVFLCNP